jgi:hypothetical protein
MNSHALRSLSHSRSCFPAALCLLAASAMACGNKPMPMPDKEPLAPSALPTTTTTAPSASAATAVAPAIPVLALEKFAPAGVHPDALYAVEGALMVVDKFRVGRVADESIEWIGKVPSSYDAFGPNRIDSVRGRWPDSIGVLFSNTNGRASQPSYLPLTGVGLQHTLSPGGGLGRIDGVARASQADLGETVHRSSERFCGYDPR